MAMSGRRDVACMVHVVHVARERVACMVHDVHGTQEWVGSCLLIMLVGEVCSSPGYGVKVPPLGHKVTLWV